MIYRNNVEVCEAFCKWVNTESCQLIRQVFGNNWYQLALSQAQGLDAETLESFNGYYRPCRLYEEGHWQLINQGLQIVAKKTGKAKVLRNKLMNLKQENLARGYDQALKWL